MHIDRMMLVVLLFWGAVGVKADSHYAAQNGQTPTSPYTNGWGSAASNIQDAVNAAAANDTVWVGAGRYTVPTNAVDDNGTNVVYLNKILTLRSSNSVPEDTIIDGGGSNRGIMVQRLGSPSPYLLVIDGFTVTDCYATNMGAGICWGQSVIRTMDTVVRNCIIENNTAVESGGGLYGYNTQATYPFNWSVSNTMIRNNRGGGLFHQSQGSLTLTDCRVEDNVGVGLWLYTATTKTNTLERCLIRGNTNGLSDGGGIYTYRGTHAFRNCLISGNSVEGANDGGAVQINAAATVTTLVTMVNCTVAGNAAAAGRTAGIHGEVAFSKLEAVNTIIYDNVRTNGQVANMGGVGLFTMNNSCTAPTNTVVGSNNLTNAPIFADPFGQNFRLTGGSPCINVGANQDWMIGAVDLDGRPRIDQGSLQVDMGCYEYAFPGGTLIMTR